MKNLIFSFLTILTLTPFSQAWTGKELDSSKSLKLTIFAPHSNKKQGLILEKTNIKGKTAYFISEFNLGKPAKPHLINPPVFQEIYLNFRKTYLSAKWKEKLAPLCGSALSVDRQVDGYTYHQALCEDTLPKKNVTEINLWYQNTLGLIRI